MSTKQWVALLRGINVGRQKRVAMADLRTLLESLGYDGVRTHLQSGNALFRTEDVTGAKLERQIASRIETDLGLDVKVLVRTSEQLETIVAENPFVARCVDPKQLHVSFLSSTPQAETIAAKIASLDRDELAPDELEIGDGVIYTRLPNGVIASHLPDWGRLLGVTVTARSWKTVTRLHDLATG